MKKIAPCAIFLIFSIGIFFTSFTRAEAIVFKVNISATAQCFNGIDDDDDGLIDNTDTGCSDPTDDQELNSSPDTASSGGGGGSSPPSTTDTSSEEPPIINPQNSISIDIPAGMLSPDGDIDFNAAPEGPTDTAIIPVPHKNPARVKIKTPLRLTLRNEGTVVFTNEPIPTPPRADNLPLFDVISELGGVSMNVVNGGLLGKVAPGELFPVSVRLFNVSGTRRLDVQLTYSIFSAGEELVYSSSDTVAVETTASFVKLIQIPYYLVPGVYVIKLNMTYDGQTVPATSHFPFTVEKKIGGIFTTTLLAYGIMFIIAVLIISGILVLLRKKYHQSSRSSPIDYSRVPNNMRTFYEITSDIVMDMRQRVGDHAISIANSIDGLKIDVESGRVASLSQNPSKIIAELVSKYEIELGKKVSFSFRQKDKTQ